MSDLLRDMSGEWDRSRLPSNVWVGADCFIESPDLFRSFASTRAPGLVLGDRVRLYLGGWGGGFGILETGSMSIGDDSVLAGVQVMGAARITVGRRVVISYNAILTDADFHPRDPDLRRRDAVLCSPTPPPGEARDPFASAPVVIGDDVRIGMNAMVLKGVTIGAGAVVLPGAVVTADVAPGATVVGNPARPVER